MNSNKPLAVILGLAIVLAATSITTSSTVRDASAALDLSATKGTPTSIVLDPLPGSVTSTTSGDSAVSRAVLHTGEKVTFTGKLVTSNGDALSNMPVKMYVLTPTPEQKLVGSAVTGIDGSFSVTWAVEPYYVKPALQETLKSSGSRTMNIFATFEGKDTFNPSKSGKMAIDVKNWDLILQMASDKSMYRQGDKAVVFINVLQGDKFGVSGGIDYGDFVTPDSIKATFDGKAIQIEKKKEGSYTFIVDSITKEHHQLIVNSGKQGYNPGTAFLTLIVEGLR